MPSSILILLHNQLVIQGTFVKLDLVTKSKELNMKPLLYHTVLSLINAVIAKSPEAADSLKKLQDHSKEKKVKDALKVKDLRFNKDMQIVPIGLHGGEREGAGRKAPRGKTVVKRFPELYITAVNALIEHLDETRNQDGNVDHESSVQCQNLDDTLITLQFQSYSRKKS
jgi:hypothetical protein